MLLGSTKYTLAPLHEEARSVVLQDQCVVEEQSSLVKHQLLIPRVVLFEGNPRINEWCLVLSVDVVVRHVTAGSGIVLIGGLPFGMCELVPARFVCPAM